MRSKQGFALPRPRPAGKTWVQDLGFMWDRTDAGDRGRKITKFA
jgi:hypothetical protein